MFIDYTKIDILSGKGGTGAVSFRREKYIPKGGPDGGNGGRGGHVLAIVDQQLHTLQDIRYHRRYQAENGQPGGSNNKTGKDGKDLLIPVPPGTIIRNVSTGEILEDLIHDGQTVIMCRGGKGGRGNASYKSSTRQSPRNFQPGLPGEEGIFEIELKLLADVGLVGLPNAGKSTLLSRVSAARPKVADYPFTTLQPYLGIVKAGDYQSFVMADIPGLIEGANLGKGLGHLFLKHIERTRILLFLIDSQESDPGKTLDTLVHELISHNPDLNKKPFIIVRSKCDLITDRMETDTLWKSLNKNILDISAVTGKGLTELVRRLRELLNEQS